MAGKPTFYFHLPLALLLSYHNLININVKVTFTSLSLCTIMVCSQFEVLKFWSTLKFLNVNVWETKCDAVIFVVVSGIFLVIDAKWKL